MTKKQLIDKLQKELETFKILRNSYIPESNLYKRNEARISEVEKILNWLQA